MHKEGSVWSVVTENPSVVALAKRQKVEIYWGTALGNFLGRWKFSASSVGGCFHGCAQFFRFINMYILYVCILLFINDISVKLIFLKIRDPIGSTLEGKQGAHPDRNQAKPQEGLSSVPDALLSEVTGGFPKVCQCPWVTGRVISSGTRHRHRDSKLGKAQWRVLSTQKWCLQATLCVVLGTGEPTLLRNVCKH